MSGGDGTGFGRVWSGGTRGEFFRGAVVGKGDGSAGGVSLVNEIDRCAVQTIVLGNLED